MGLSFGEIVVIILVAFLVLGPDKLPDAGRTLGKTLNSFKKALSDSNLNIKEEMDAIKKETDEFLDSDGIFLQLVLLKPVAFFYVL